MIGRCDGTQSVSHPLFIKHLPLKLMKKIILLLSILTSLYFYCTARAQGYYPNEYLFYDINSGAPFVYNKTLPCSGHVQFNCPFAYNIVQKGSHLEFSITNEDFKWFIVRKATNNYIDFEANIYDGASLGWTIPNDSFPDRNTSLPVLTNKYIIRVEFNK